MKKTKVLSIILILSIALCGCSMGVDNAQAEEEITVSYTADDIVNADDMFTDRDLSYDYSDREVFFVTLKDNASSSDCKNVDIKNNIVSIKSEGVFVITGSLSNGQIIVDAGDNDKIQLVLNDVSINCDTSAAIYCRNAKKLFVTTIGDSTLSNKKDFVNDEENINGVIYSKSNLTLNGDKKLVINAVYGNSVVSNDDLAITSGEYSFTAQNHTIKANDSIRITGADIILNATKDAIHCENDDVKKGFVYIKDGSITINAKDDGIQSSSAIKISGGIIDIKESKEGIEGRFIDVAGGSVSIVASDDGFNASDKSQKDTNTESSDIDKFQANQPEPSGQAPPNMPDRPDKKMQKPPADMPDNFNEENKKELSDMSNAKFDKMGSDSTDCSLVISDGEITVDAQGDGLDSNGIIKIAGGKTVVYGAQDNGNCAFDYQTQATITGGSIIAIGMSGMAEGFSNSSTQGSILYNLDSDGSANDNIELIKNSKSIISTLAVKKYNSILISSPAITKGKYTIIAGNVEEKITLDSISYSNSKSKSFEMKKDGFKDNFKREENQN